ncbi:hypothetical protein BX070DRAFT_230501 [Coemansia spiralis]|nr:hypothetical protein BX070DRAFT_230501 [Coemansia spiralis]
MKRQLLSNTLFFILAVTVLSLVNSNASTDSRCQLGSRFVKSNLSSINRCSSKESLPLVARTVRSLGIDIEESEMAVKKVCMALGIVVGCAAYVLSTV